MMSFRDIPRDRKYGGPWYRLGVFFGVLLWMAALLFLGWVVKVVVLGKAAETMREDVVGHIFIMGLVGLGVVSITLLILCLIWPAPQVPEYCSQRRWRTLRG